MCTPRAVSRGPEGFEKELSAEDRLERCLWAPVETFEKGLPMISPLPALSLRLPGWGK